MTKTVLLIDYDPRSISRIRTLLNAAGYHTIVAHDAQQGREEFERAAPHLTLIQDLLPKGHGFEICRELKTTELGRKRAVVLLTSQRGGGRRHELLQTRCDDFVVKPFDDETLLKTVRRIAPPELAATPKRKSQAIGNIAMVASNAEDIPNPDIPVEFSEADIGSRLDELLLGPAAEEPVETPEARPANGKKKRRSVMSLLGFAGKSERSP